MIELANGVRYIVDERRNLNGDGLILQTRNLETWRRLSRLEILDLIQELSGASLATLDQWPRSGEGRDLKEACENAFRALDLTNHSNLATGMEELDK